MCSCHTRESQINHPKRISAVTDPNVFRRPQQQLCSGQTITCVYAASVSAMVWSKVARAASLCARLSLTRLSLSERTQMSCCSRSFSSSSSLIWLFSSSRLEHRSSIPDGDKSPCVVGMWIQHWDQFDTDVAFSGGFPAHQHDARRHPHQLTSHRRANYPACFKIRPVWNQARQGD